MSDALDLLHARLLSESGVLVFDDSTPAVLRLWFCARTDAPPHGRWFQLRGALPEPLTALPGEWVELWREESEADAGDEGRARKHRWCEWWRQATEQAAHLGLYVHPGRNPAAEAGPEAEDDGSAATTRAPFWLAFCPDGRTVSNDSARPWPHPASWRLRWKREHKRKSHRHPMGPRRPERRFDQAPRRTRNAIWIDACNSLRSARVEQSGVLFWSHYAWRPREHHFEGYFCGGRRRVYSCEIVTAWFEYSERVRELAEAEIEAQRVPTEDEAQPRNDFFRDSPMIPSGARNSDADGLYVYRWLSEPSRFSRRVREAELEQQCAARIADERRLEVFESAVMGNAAEQIRQVRFVVDQPNLDREIVDASIRRFLEQGERGGQGSVGFRFDAAQLKALGQTEESGV